MISAADLASWANQTNMASVSAEFVTLVCASHFNEGTITWPVVLNAGTTIALTTAGWPGVTP